MSFKFNRELTHRIEEIDEILRDPSLTEEEKKYYQQLKMSIWDTQTEELKKIRERSMTDFVNLYKEAFPTVLNKYPEGYDPRKKYDFSKTIEFNNLKQRIFDYFSRQDVE